MMKPGRLVLGLCALGLGLTACQGELAPRNTIQHGVIAKEDLTGADGKAVFYYLQTVVDVPYATGFTFTGEQSLMEKIRWDIQEKVLYARRAYEWVRGSEIGSGEQGSAPGKVMGAPIAGFAIEKHFDIIRDYNAATGEEINKIVENDTDRHWYERKFIRVDWSRNLVPSFEFLVHFDDDAVSPLRQEAVPYYASNPDDPDALRIRRPDATPEEPRPGASYLEVTSKLLVTPELTTETYVDGKYRLPACYLAEDNGPEFASTDCSPQEVKVRHSFLRATARDYDALAYDDRWMERFGYFSTERQSYDPQYQETETGRVRLINRWNLWRKVLAESSCSLTDHYKPGADARAAADAARRAADAACAALEGDGSTCASVQRRCTLPYDKREGVRPIVYYLSAGFPAELRKAAEESIASWNDALGTTAARLLYPKDNPADAKLLGERKAELGALFELRDNDCNELRVNEVIAAHPELGARVVAAAGLAADAAPPFTLDGKALTLACSALESATAGLPAGERFEWQRIGDLRYSMLYWVGLPTRAGLLGYGPSSADPETGETIQATVFIYGAVHDSYTARSTDIVGLLGCADEKCIQSYAQGVPIADWVAQAKSGTSKARTSFSDEEIATMAKAMNTSWLKAAAKELPPLDFSSLEALRVSRRARATALASSKLLGQNGKTSSARLKPLQGTALEEMAKNQYLAGIGRPATSPFPALGGAPSFAELAGPGLLAERRRVRRLLAKRKLELASFWDNAILGLALRYKETGKPRAEIFKDLRARLFKGVAEHEVGHTLGLRHNFAASYDAMNYSPSYWKLRTLDATGKALPRYKSPFSELELKGNAKDPTAREGLGSYQYASVMDYGAKFNSDIAGLGYWDRAAIKFGYGQLVEVFEKTGASADDRYLLANVQTSMRWGEPLLFTLTCDGKSYRSVHYTEYPRLLGGVANLASGNRVDVPLRKLTTQKLDKVVPGCAVYADGFGASDVPVDDRGRFEVPYRFCSDEYEGASPECNAFDAGADPYEQAQTIIDSYHAYYLFHNLKLNRLGFSLWGYLDTLSSRTFDPLRSSMQFYLLIRGELTLDPRNAKFLGDTELEAFYKADNGYGPWTVAVDRSLNLLLDVLATPEPGDYWIDLDNRYGTIPYVDTATGKELPPDLNLGIPSAKYGATSWDFDSGYFWYDKMANVGVYHDKVLALWALTDPDTWFMGRDTATDQRQYAINYYRLYPELVTRYMQGLMAEDWSATGHLAANKTLFKRDFTVGGAPPAGALPVDPQLGFSLQFWGALLGVSLIPATYDTAFLDSCRIWVKGSVEEITPSDTPTCIADPIGGKSYCAMTRKNAAGVQTGVGAAMIARAQTLKDLYTADPSEENRLHLVQYIDSLELMRSITRTFGSTPL